MIPESSLVRLLSLRRIFCVAHSMLPLGKCRGECPRLMLRLCFYSERETFSKLRALRGGHGPLPHHPDSVGRHATHSSFGCARRRPRLREALSVLGLFPSMARLLALLHDSESSSPSGRLRSPIKGVENTHTHTYDRMGNSTHL